MRVAIAGLGLIGGSLARALRAAGHEVIGIDRAPVLRRARAARALSGAAPRIAALPPVDVLVLAAPPATNLRLLREALAAPARAVTDVSSVKRAMAAEARRLRLGRFVGGHPMAGTEAQGFSASRGDLFQGRPWVITSPRPWRGPAALVARLARTVGSRPVALTPEEHDRAAAFLSHLPQIAAWAVAGAAAADPVARRHLHIAGPAFASFARLARSPRPLWDEILAANAAEVRRAVAAFRRALRR